MHDSICAFPKASLKIGVYKLSHYTKKNIIQNNKIETSVLTIRLKKSDE